MTYQEYLKKHKLELNRFYDCDFTLDSIYQDSKKINSIKFELPDGLSPCIIIHCYNDEKWVGCFGLMIPEFITDKYDRQSIVSAFTKTNDGEDYDIKNLSKILKFIKMK